MRAWFVLIALTASARAEDALSLGAAVGAGGQGASTYGALDLRLDGEWHGVRIGLGARGVWEDGVFRRRDWSRLADAVSAVRLLEASTRGGTAAIAAGALAPAQIAHVADGHRASLDDRLRTGARGVVVTDEVELGLEIDDVIDPTLVGGAVTWQVAPPWGLHVATAIDPGAPGGVASAIELAGAHRWDARHRRIEVGAGIVGEPRDGVGVVAFGSAMIDRAGARWFARTDLRAGTGTNGAAFGPLYRLERSTLHDEARAGVGGGLSAGVIAPTGWISLGARVRPGLGPLGSVSAGAPMGRWLQAGGWIAASTQAAAGAGELRIAWAKRLFSALQLARMYATEQMQPSAVWSATVWFGASTGSPD